MSESNVFLLINLGCEMLYVIDQRLQAQSVPFDKSTQVMREITTVFLDPKFLDQLIAGSQQKQHLLTVEHCKLMLNDIACCSLMRLDGNSMDKLWDLIAMIFKWQLFTSKYPQHILNITFRHLDGIAQLYPDVKKSILIDYTKNKILHFWNSNEELQLKIYKTLKSWFECFSMKISILIRLGFQSLDGTFLKKPDVSFFDEFVLTAGDNIFIKTSTEMSKISNEPRATEKPHNYDNLLNQLNIVNTSEDDQQNKKSPNDILKDLLFDEKFKFTVEENSGFDHDPDESKNDTTSNEFTKITTSRSSVNSWEYLLKTNKLNNDGVDLKSLLLTNLK